jgi:hypothetical protein
MSWGDRWPSVAETGPTRRECLPAALTGAALRLYCAPPVHSPTAGSPAPSTVAPRTDWRERVAPGEDALWERLAVQLRDAARAGAGQPARALHTKGSAGLRAELRVLPDVPEAARVGIFARPATYRAYVRVSNGTMTRREDDTPDVRGLAVKVLGVPGTKLLQGMEQATTQDFLTIRSPFAPFTGPEEFVWVACASQQPKTFLPKALLHLGPVRALRLIATLRKNLSVAYPSAAASTFHSALAIRCGDYAARYSVAADDASVPAPAPAGPEHVREDLAARLRRGPVHYTLRLQFFVGEDKTPIEDSGVEWLEADSPFVAVARLTLLPQDVDSEAGQRLATYVEGLSFDPWHAPVEFRPLGAMMRARRVAYRVSTLARGTQPEPTGPDWPA